MGNHPINLALRFVLELGALFVAGYWGWKQSDTWLRFLLVTVIPLAEAIIWGVFAVPDDPSRSGKAPIPIPGFIRLGIEFVIFGFACWACYNLGYTEFAWLAGVVVVVHYLVSYERVQWLLSK